MSEENQTEPVTGDETIEARKPKPPPKPKVVTNQTWPGMKNQQARYTKPGTYQFPPNSGVALKESAQQVYAVTVSGNGVTLRRLIAKEGFRCYSIRSVSNIVLEDCESEGAGVAGSGHGSGGQGLYADNVTNVTLRRFKCRMPAGHGVYWALTCRTLLMEDCEFTARDEHAPLIQGNSGDGGSGIFDWTVRRGRYEVQDNSTPAFNLLGSGERNRPVLLDGVTVFGRFVVSNYAAPRPSFAELRDCQVTGGVLVEGGSILKLTGSTKITGQITCKTGGKVVKS